MQQYKNLSGREAIESYESGADFIIVKFSEPSKSGYHTYKYTSASAGAENVEQMKGLAEAGDGLGDFIQMNVRKLYEEKS